MLPNRHEFKIFTQCVTLVTLSPKRLFLEADIFVQIVSADDDDVEEDNE